LLLSFTKTHKYDIIWVKIKQFGGYFMKYINQADYDYIMNKYHDQDAPFNPLKRFVRNDKIFEASDGMEPEQLLAGILENDKIYQSLPHSIRKAHALEYVLKNTRISCDRRDIFPALNMIDRPLKQTIVQMWKDEIFQETVPEVEARRAQLEKDGIVTIWPDYDHTVPMWDRLLSLGYTGILAESEQIRASKPRTPEEDAFFEGIKLTYEAILEFIDRLYQAATLPKM
jgi:hypothetical protein